MTHRIAIIGAGPAGCFLAQALLKAEPGLAVDLIDRLPIPYGLVRYGVAPDHQGTKAVTRQFARIFERQGARFFGNVEVGRDVDLGALQDAYDAVVLATGLSGDRRLGIPGDDLPGIIGSGDLTRAITEHPDAKPLPDLGPRPLIVGNGNVALDILRLLAKSPEELDGSDLGPGPTRWLAESGIDAITVVGRSPATKARFDAVMVKELARLTGVRIETDPLPEASDPEAARLIEALESIAGHGTGPRIIRFRFGLTPAEVLGSTGYAEALRVTSSDGSEEVLPASAIITAIGFENAGAFTTAPGLYAAGWFGTGPRGTIPEARSGAQTLAQQILSDLAATPPKNRTATPVEGLVSATDYATWTRIDAIETTDPPPGRCRRKLTTRAEMLAHAKTPEPEDSHT